MGRRFIGIDMNPWSIEVTWHRCMNAIDAGKNIPMRRPDGQRSQIIIKIVQPLKVPMHVPPTSTKRYAIDWLDGNSYLLLGDCIEIMKAIPKEIVDLIYIDPPYNSGGTYKASKGFYDFIKANRAKRAWPELGQNTRRI